MKVVGGRWLGLSRSWNQRPRSYDRSVQSANGLISKAFLPAWPGARAGSKALAAVTASAVAVAVRSRSRHRPTPASPPTRRSRSAQLILPDQPLEELPRHAGQLGRLRSTTLRVLERPRDVVSLEALLRLLARLR